MILFQWEIGMQYEQITMKAKHKPYVPICRQTQTHTHTHTHTQTYESQPQRADTETQRGDWRREGETGRCKQSIRVFSHVSGSTTTTQ